MDSPHAKCPKGQEVFPCTPHGRHGSDSADSTTRERSESGPKPKAGTVEQYTATVGALTAEARCKGPLSLVKTHAAYAINAADSNSTWSACTTALGCSVFAAISSSKAASAGPPTSRNSGNSSASASHSSIHRSTGHCFVAHWLAGASTANARPTVGSVPMRGKHCVKPVATQRSRQCIQRPVARQQPALLVPDVHASQERMPVEHRLISLAHADVDGIFGMRSMPRFPQRGSQDGVPDEGRLDEQYFPRGHGAKIRGGHVATGWLATYLAAWLDGLALITAECGRGWLIPTRLGRWHFHTKLFPRRS